MYICIHEPGISNRVSMKYLPAMPTDIFSKKILKDVDKDEE